MKMFKKLISIYEFQSVEKKAALWFAICSIINKGISLIVVPIYTRILTIEEYGTYGVFLSWFDFFAIIATLNISQGHYPIGITKYNQSINEYTSSMLGLGSIDTIIMLGLFFIFKKPVSIFVGLPENVIICTLLCLIVYPAWDFWRIQKRFDYQYKIMVSITLCVSIITPIIGILGIKILNLGLSSAISSKLIVQGILACILYYIMIKRKPKLFNMMYWKEAFSFNAAMIPYFLSTIILSQADRIMIYNLKGEAEAAIYSIAYSISMIMFLVNGAIGDSFLPWLYKNLKKNVYDSIDPVTNKLLLLVAGLDLLFILFVPEAVLFFAPAKYQQGIWIIPPLTSSTFFIFLFQRYINVELYYGATKENSIVSICIAILNIGLNYFSIELWGYEAAAYTTLISYMIFAFVHFLIVRKVCNYNCNKVQIYSFKFPFLIGTAFLIIAFALMLLYPYVIIRYLLIMICIIMLYMNRRKLKKLLGVYMQ